MHRPGPQPGRQREARIAIVDEQGQVLMLAVVAVIAAECLMAMHRIIAGIDIQDDLLGPPATRADKQVDQVVVEDLDAAGLGGTDLPQDRTFWQGQFGLSSGVGVLEACQGRAAGQGVVGIGADVGEDLEEGVVAELLGVIAVGVAGEDLIDGLGEDDLGGVFDVLGGSGVGEPLGEVGDDAEGFFEGSYGEQSGIGDNASAVEGDVNLL